MSRKLSFVIAAPTTGTGKTTITIGLLRALVLKGYTVQPFKAGPDFEDPWLHALAAGRPSFNLDLWLMGQPYVEHIFSETASGTDVTVIEGMMGLYDGLPGGAGSTAHLAKILGLPVVLVLDAQAGAQSIAAIALGFQQYDRNVKVAGIIVNRVASEGHRSLIAESLDKVGLPLLGAIPFDDRLTFPGGAGFAANQRIMAWIKATAGILDRSLDWQLFRRCVCSAGLSTVRSLPTTAAELAAKSKYLGLRLAAARDAAFCFYYQDYPVWLKQLGIELVEFSPLQDPQLPPGIDGLLLGNGPLSQYVADLAANKPMLQAIRAAYYQGMPIYGEGGGFQYLLDQLITRDGSFPLTGCLRGSTVMQDTLQGFGYRFAIPAWEVGQQQEDLRGHLFHYARAQDMQSPPLWKLKNLSGQRTGDDGVIAGDCLGGFLHIHWPTQPRLAENFFQRCNGYRRRRR